MANPARAAALAITDSVRAAARARSHLDPPSGALGVRRNTVCDLSSRGDPISQRRLLPRLQVQ